LKINYITEDYRQDSRSNDDNLISYYDWEAWHAIII